MRRIILRLVVALLAVTIVVVGTISYRAITSHRLTVLHEREAVLRDDLWKMRALIDQYAADKGSLPSRSISWSVLGTCARFPKIRLPDREIGWWL